MPCHNVPTSNNNVGNSNRESGCSSSNSCAENPISLTTVATINTMLSDSENESEVRVPSLGAQERAVHTKIVTCFSDAFARQNTNFEKGMGFELQLFCHFRAFLSFFTVNIYRTN